MFRNAFSASPEQLKRIEFERLKHNSNRLFYLSAFTAVWELIMVCGSIFGQRFYQEGTYLYYCAAYIVNFMFNLITLAVSYRYRSSKAQSYETIKSFRIILILYVVITLLWSLLIVYLDQHLLYKQVIAYVVSLVIVSSMLDIHPRAFLAINCFSTVILMMILYETRDNTSVFLGNTANLVILILFILLSHYIKYYSFYESELSKMEIERLSYEDPLTGVKNRRSLQEYSEKYFKKSEQDSSLYSAIMIDIDHFKKFNDLYGHNKGDLLLKMMGKTLNTAAEMYNADAFRFGGEEFLVLCEEIKPGQARETAEYISERFKSKSMEFRRQNEKPVTISIGISYTQNICALDEFYHFIAEADNALYKAKEKGRDQIVSAREDALVTKR